jgi:hypothetical protein
MSTLAVKQTNESPKYAENVLPLIANFDDDFTWNIVSGGSNGVVENSSTERYAGKKSLRVAFTGTDEITFNRGNSDFQVFGLRGGQYILSYRFFKSDPSADVTFKVNVYVGGVLYPQNEIEQNLYSTSGFTDDVWNAYTQIITIGDSETLDFSFTAQSDTTGCQLYFDGMSLLYNDRELSPLNLYRPVEIEINVSELIDVPSISSNSYETVVATVTGAIVGDFVQMTYPAELITLGAVVSYPIVTDTNEVSFLIHNHTGGAIDPASGLYTFKIIR